MGSDGCECVWFLRGHDAEMKKHFHFITTEYQQPELHETE